MRLRFFGAAFFAAAAFARFSINLSNGFLAAAADVAAAFFSAAPLGFIADADGVDLFRPRPILGAIFDGADFLGAAFLAAGFGVAAFFGAAFFAADFFL